MRVFMTVSDGEIYHAKDAVEFVQRFKDSSRFGVDLSLNKFMREVAERVKRETGHNVNGHSARQFLAGLIAAGLVKEKHNVDEKAA